MRQTRIFTFESLDELASADAAGLINHYDIVQVDEDDSIRRWSEATKTWMKRGGKIRTVEDAAGLHHLTADILADALEQLNYQEETSMVFWMLTNGVSVKFAKVRP